MEKHGTGERLTIFLFTRVRGGGMVRIPPLPDGERNALLEEK
ncbi:MAG: hypothetical protein ABSD81_01830 [Methanomicrobiales archaeon]